MRRNRSFSFTNTGNGRCMGAVWFNLTLSLKMHRVVGWIYSFMLMKAVVVLVSQVSSKILKKWKQWLVKTGSSVKEREGKGRISGCETQKQHSHSPVLPVGFLFCFAAFALFLLRLISLKYSLQLPPLPKDLFMAAGALNPSSLYSSEAVRWQLLMSMLMMLPPTLTPLHCQLREAKVPTVMNSLLSGVRVWV